MSLFPSIIIPHARSRVVATSKMERFVIIVNVFLLLTIITKRSILNVAAALIVLPYAIIMVIRIYSIEVDLGQLQHARWRAL